MNTSQRGLELIKHFEGLRLKPYVDAGGKMTVGWGHTRFENVQQRITMERAKVLLALDVADAEVTLRTSVGVPLNQNQYDALVSFIFNVGAGAFRSSSLLKLLNMANYEGAATQFDRWVWAGKKKMKGLVRRRAAERKLFEEPVVVVQSTLEEQP